MGVVWKAADTNLDREVAVKFLPEGFGDDPERLARFEREAKTLATLNHPNIAGVYGLHEADGVRFLAMELVPGEDLSTRLQRGPMPIDEALEVATQIAEGLATAHDGGVIHRDLKPANVRAAPDGRCRVLDFGLAKAVDAAPASGSTPTVAPTVTSAGTAAGIILGTASYMSPEQARGKPVDRQTDVWAFGCVLYELLTARVAFDGETVTDVLAAIVRSEPDYDLLPADTPPTVRRVIERCLRKAPRERLRDLGDIGLTLREVASGASDASTSGEAAVAQAATPAPAARTGVGWKAIAAVDPVFSPDENRIAFASSRGEGGVFVMGATGESPQRVAEAGYDPAWSPDGSRLIFTSENVDNPYSRSTRATLTIVNLADRTQQVIDTIDAVAPAWSPNDRRIAFWTTQNRGQRDIVTVRVDGTDPIFVTEDSATDWGPFWSPDGGWLYFVSDRGGSPDLWRVQIDEVSGRPRSEPEAVTSGVADIREAAISGDGRSVALQAFETEGGLWTGRFDPERGELIGQPEQRVGHASRISQSDISPDGQWFTYAKSQPREMIFVMSTDGQVRRKLIDNEFRNRGPIFSRDGRWITFYSNSSGNYEIWAIRPDGSGLRQITEGEASLVSPDWTYDGQTMITGSLHENRSVMMRVDVGPSGIDGVDGLLAPQPVPMGEDLQVVDIAPDGRRVLTFQTAPEVQSVVFDIETGAQTTVSGIPHLHGLSLSADRRTALAVTLNKESDIWLLTLESD